MVILQLSGGLGNQMFEYALYLSLRAKGKHVKIDDVSDYRTPDRRPVQLSVFDADYERASEEEVIRYTDSSLSPLSRIRRKLTGRKSLLYRERDMEYDETVFERDPVYLTGFFQSEKYFADVKEEVRRRLTFSERVKAELSESYREILTRIEAVPSVSVHVRRGDYLHASHNGMYEGICTLDYYRKAMAQIREKEPEAVFFLFSNDMEWTKEHLAGPDCVPVEGGSEEKGYLDLYLMSRCRHNIIANSSFSWWGAWLNDNPEKQVIAPARWINGRECRDIYTEGMIRI